MDGGGKGPQGTVVPVGQTAFSFDIPVQDGAYLVRPHFAEVYQSEAGACVFDVAIEDNEVLTGLDIYEEAGGADKAIVREFEGEITDGELNIHFIRPVENVKIDSIEIIPVTDWARRLRAALFGSLQAQSGRRAHTAHCPPPATPKFAAALGPCPAVLDAPVVETVRHPGMPSDRR